jgi:hypothetical protein
MVTFTLLNKAFLSLDRKNFVGGLFCDLHKAFDYVNHDKLLTKMEFYGISSMANKLMRSYLENRYQRISMKDSRFNKVYSKWEHCKTWSATGLGIGPITISHLYK